MKSRSRMNFLKFSVEAIQLHFHSQGIKTELFRTGRCYLVRCKDRPGYERPWPELQSDTCDPPKTVYKKY